MSAEESEEILSKIENDGSWLSETMPRFPEPDCGSLECLKHRIRIAVYEHSQEVEQPPTVSEETLDRIKSAVRVELELGRVQPSPEHLRGQRWWSRHRSAVIALAAAAVVLLMLTPWERIGPPQSPGDDPSSMEDFVDVLASTSPSTEADVLWVRSEIDEIEELLSDPWPELLAPELEELEDLGVDIDRLLSESGNPSDV